MILLIKKVNCNNIKEYKVYKAQGKILNVNEEEKCYIEEAEQIGMICLDKFRRTILHAGNIRIGEAEKKIEFDITEIENDDGRKRRARKGQCFEAEEIKYVIEEKFHTKKSFWIFRSGYEYFSLIDKKKQIKYKVLNITFASDMHYYYVYNDMEELKAIIYKPYRKVGEDEYQIFSMQEDLNEALLFFAAYVDLFFYPYNSALNCDAENRYAMYEDDAAYTISDDELLKLYDDSFVRRVILNET